MKRAGGGSTREQEGRGKATEWEGAQRQGRGGKVEAGPATWGAWVAGSKRFIFQSQPVFGRHQPSPPTQHPRTPAAIAQSTLGASAALFWVSPSLQTHPRLNLFKCRTRLTCMSWSSIYLVVYAPLRATLQCEL